MLTPYEWNAGFDMGGTMPGVEQLFIQDWLIEQIKAHDYVEHTAVLKQWQRKWRVSSAMQKSIRRGNEFVAERMANALLGHEPDYVWRRLPVIVLEEIGAANVALVATMLWVAGKKQWRAQHGGDQLVLQVLVRLMCRSVKDRSVCDLMIWADECPDLADERKAIFETWAQPGGLETIHGLFLDKDAFLPRRMLAGWAIAGTKSHPGSGVPENTDGSINHLIGLCNHYGCPAVVQAIMRWGSTKVGDAMPIAYPLIWQQVEFSKTVAWAPDDIPQIPMIGPYPSEAFDWHCREGKKALVYFNKACEPMAALLDACGLVEDPDNPKLVDAKTTTNTRRDATSSLLFRAEGSLVDRRLVYDGSKDLLDLAEFALNRNWGIRGDVNDYGMKLMRANLPLMHWCRLKVLDIDPVGDAGFEKPEPVDVAPNTLAAIVPNAPAKKMKLMLKKNGN